MARAKRLSAQLSIQLSIVIKADRPDGLVALVFHGMMSTFELALFNAVGQLTYRIRRPFVKRRIAGAMEAYDSGGVLFLAMAVILSLLALFIVLRAVVRAAPSDRSLRALFVPVPKTSQSIYTLETDD